MEIDWDYLAREALRASKGAYAPYSLFPVGAALIASSGKVYRGANIENISFSLTLCAERVAVFKAISEGEREFCALAVATNSSPPSAPCGACRQVIIEFSPELPVLLVNPNGERCLINMKELLPLPFHNLRTGCANKPTGQGGSP